MAMNNYIHGDLLYEPLISMLVDTIHFNIDK